MNQSFLFFELIGIFIVHWLILEPQTYVIVEQFGAENIRCSAGVLFSIFVVLEKLWQWVLVLKIISIFNPYIWILVKKIVGRGVLKTIKMPTRSICLPFWSWFQRAMRRWMQLLVMIFFFDFIAKIFSKYSSITMEFCCRHWYILNLFSFFFILPGSGWKADPLMRY